MSSRRPPEWDEDWDEPARPRRRATPPRRVRTFGLPVVAAALVGGLFVGYVASSGGGGTTTVTETRTVTAPATQATSGVRPSGEATRSTISVAILNGSGESGLAARTAESAREIGYQTVSEGNAPSPVSTDIVLHRQGSAPRAARVAEDLGLPAPELASADDPALAAAPDAEVVVLLGPTGDAPAGDGGTTTAPATDATDASAADGAASSDATAPPG